MGGRTVNAPILPSNSHPDGSLSFFNAIGPNETNPHLFLAILTQIKAGKRTIRLGNLTPKRDYIHVNDMAEAVYQLMITTDNHYDIFNLGSGQAYSVLEIVQVFEEVLGEKITIETDETKVRKVERMHWWLILLSCNRILIGRLNSISTKPFEIY
ncbi:MAG: NAD-dependent epimerase/dehydratase family protein [Spirosomataceae bacterium]